jgi:uncharacterized membrane protein (UPF0182 family)
VLVGFGSKVAFEDTLDDALNALFGGNSGASAGDTGVSNGTGGTPTTGGTTGGGGTKSGTTSAALKSALRDAQQALKERQAAYGKNDLVAAAQADDRLQKALQRAVAAGG